jgi:internalin A
MSANQVSDLAPITALTRLTQLYLSSNRIQDSSALQSLTGLTELYLVGNPLRQKNCPVKPESVCRFD